MSAVTTLAFIDRSGFGFLVCGVLCIGVGIVTYNDFFQCDFIQIRNHAEWTDPAGYTVPQFIALVIGTFMLPLGLCLILIFVAQSSKNKWNDSAKILTYATLCGLSTFGVVLAYQMAADVLSCGVFCMGSNAEENEKNDAAIIFMGLIYFFVGLGMSGLFFYLTVLSFFRSFEPEIAPAYISSSDDHDSKPLLPSTLNGLKQSVPPSTVGRRKHLTVTVVVLTFAVMYPLMFFACTALPTWWSYFSRYNIQAYQASVPDIEYGSYWSVQMGGNTVLKLFPDILIFYGYIYLVASVALLSEAWPTLRYRMLARPSLLFGFCVGEVLLCISLVTLVACQFCYWYFDHGWEESAITSRTPEERAARSIGQVSNLVVGLLVLPISRNSVWSIVFGVSWEAMVKYHQILGYLLIACILAHMFLWWAVFAQQDSFPHDIFAVPTIYHKDNFTIPLATVMAMVVLICMGGLAHYVVRRANYDIFYWSHHVFMAFFLVMLWHATMSWYYITGGLVLWVVDHIIRLSRSVGYTTNLQKLSISGAGNVVSLGYTVAKPNSLFSGSNPFARGSFEPLPHGMGQYCYINVPEISQLAWHPFTISSTPGEAITTHHIKSMGNEQWTGRLLFLARALQATQKAQINNIVVNIDGPYGVPLQASRYRNVLLVAGGIGITPMHSCFRHIFLSHMGTDRWSYAHMKKIRLIWVVRNLADASTFEESLKEIGISTQTRQSDAYSGGGPLFSYSVFVTGGGGNPHHPADFNYAYGSDLHYKQTLMGIAATAFTGPPPAINDLKVKNGRPDLQSEILALSPWGMEALVFACGPPSLIEACSKYSQASHVDFRAETFEL